MNEHTLIRLFLSIVFLSPIPSFGQGSLADYQRAEGLEPSLRNLVYRDDVRPQWIESDGSDVFWYRVQTGEERHAFIYVDPGKRIRRPAFDHAQLATTLSAAADETVDPTELPFRWITLSESGTKVDFTAFGKRWSFDNTTGTISDIGVGLALESTAIVLTRVKPSGSRGFDSELHLVNQTENTVRIYWIDRDGERVAYGELEPGKTRRQHTFAGHVWLATDVDGNPLGAFEARRDPSDAVINGKNPPSLEKVSDGDGEERRERRRAISSPDQRWEASRDGCNILVKDNTNGETFALTIDGTEDDAYQGRFWWSPDSRFLTVLRETRGDERKIQFVESAPKDQVQPKLHTLPYDKPGDKLPIARPCLFDVSKRRAIPIDTALFPNAWSISDLRWQPDAHSFRFLYNQRGHQVLRVLSVDAETGAVRTLIDEQAETFIDYTGKVFVEHLDATNEILWMSERDGWNHLYLYDATTGMVKNQVTQGNWVVRKVERVDREKRQIWFAAGGIRSAQDPYYLHLCRVNFDGSGLTILTEGDGTHQWAFTPSGRYFIDTWSRVDLPPVTELRDSENGTLVLPLESGDWKALLEKGWQTPERFVAMGRDGITPIYGVIYRPSNLDPQRRYPVIESIYAGPHSSFTPKNFASFRGEMALAELGFIVVKLDGMGTSDRSKAFHDVCWKNLGDSGFPDRILWIKAAAEKYAYMDSTRVGIFGGSAGGQSALRALLAFGDFYKVAVADCGCHDNRMDKVWWNEQWMGWPIGPHYEEQSNVTQAHRLTGKLLLTVGEMDTNVDPASTMQVVDALIRADKDFDLIVFPGRGHGIGSGPYGTRRMRDFFVRHLHTREPRWE